MAEPERAPAGGQAVNRPGPGQVALASGVAILYDTGVRGIWRAAGTTWRVTGIVHDPGNLADGFALVTPGQVRHPAR